MEVNSENSQLYHQLTPHHTSIPQHIPNYTHLFPESVHDGTDELTSDIIGLQPLKYYVFLHLNSRFKISNESTMVGRMTGLELLHAK